MSSFIRSSAEIGAARRSARLSGFTEAERAAADWARGLTEVKEKYARTTNGQRRQAASPSRAKEEERRVAKKEDVELVQITLADSREEKRRKVRKLAKDVREFFLEKEKETELEREARKLDKTLRKMARQQRRERREAKRAREQGEEPVAVPLDESAAALPEPPAHLRDAIDDLLFNARQKAAAEHREDSASPEKEPRKAAPLAPYDPKNPLGDAHDIMAYMKLCRERINRKRKEREYMWDHNGYLYRSPSPNRERIEGAFRNTRKDAWRSRAGGVYLPPAQPGAEENEEERSESPARYKYPEEFRRSPKVRRRSPSYNPEPREEGAPQRGARPLKRRKRRRSSSRSSLGTRKRSSSASASSRHSRRSPVYELDKHEG